MSAAAFRRHRLPALVCAAAVFTACAALPGIAGSGARAQDRDCYRARSHVTGERVWVCRDARGQWEVAPERRRLPQRGIARPSAPVIINRPLAAPAPPPPRVSGRAAGAGDALTAAAVRADNLSLQRALNAAGCDAGRADGVWGAQSRRAARCFQRSIGAPLTGELTDDQVSWLRDLTRDQVAGLDSAPVGDGAVAEEGADTEDRFGDDSDNVGDAGEEDALPDPVGLPDLRIDVSRERMRDGEAGHGARDDAPGHAPAPGDDPAETVVLDDARDGAEAIADAWRSESDRLASVLSDDPAAADAPRPDAPRPDTPRPDAPPKPAATPPAPRIAAAPTPLNAPSPPAGPAAVEHERTRARQAEIARLAPMLGLEPTELRAACRQGMRERQDEITPMVLMFNRVCRAHAYAENDDMLKLGYDARLAAAGDREAQQAMAERRKAAEAAQSGRDAAKP